MLSHAEETDSAHQPGKSIQVSEYRALKVMSQEGTWEGCQKTSLDFTTPEYCVHCGRAPEKLLKPMSGLQKFED